MPSIRKGPILVCPPGLLKTVLGKPESMLAALVPIAESISSKYTLRDPRVQPTEFHVGLLRKGVTERLALLAPDLSDEVSYAFDKVWDSSTEWNTVINMASIEEIVARAITRVIFPLPLCRFSPVDRNFTFISNGNRSQ